MVNGLKKTVKHIHSGIPFNLEKKKVLSFAANEINTNTHELRNLIHMRNFFVFY